MWPSRGVQQHHHLAAGTCRSVAHTNAEVLRRGRWHCDVRTQVAAASTFNGCTVEMGGDTWFPNASICTIAAVLWRGHGFAVPGIQVGAVPQIMSYVVHRFIEWGRGEKGASPGRCRRCRLTESICSVNVLVDARSTRIHVTP